MPTTSPSSNGSDSNIGGGGGGVGGGGVGSGEPSRWHGAIATGGADDCIRIFRDRGSLRDPASVAASVAASGSVSESASASAFAHAPASEDSMCNCCSGDEGGDSCRSGVVAMSTSEGEEGQEEEEAGPLFLDVEVFAAHRGDVNCVAWNPVDPALLASAGDDLCVKVWSYEN